jgi:hypothetical protein
VRRLLLALAFTAGCASIPPAIAPGPLSSPLKGLNDAFHGPITPEVVAHYAGYGGIDFTIRTPQLSAEALRAYYASVADLSLYYRSFIGGRLRTIALVEGQDVSLGADLARQHPDAIENGNELELPPHELTPQQYAFLQGTMHDAERATGFTGDIIMGGVYALTPETRLAIKEGLSRCHDCLVGVHLYTISAEDIAWLNAQNADVAITETGSHTNCRPSGPDEQAAYQAALYAAARQIWRLKYFIVYQGPDGPTCSDADTFGVRGKPAEELFR